MVGVQARVVTSITLRAAMGRRRALLFAIPPLILLVVTVLLKLAHPERASWPSDVLGIFGFTVVLPLTALIIGTSVLGAEIDDGSVIHLLSTPVSRPVVAASACARWPRSRTIRAWPRASFAAEARCRRAVGGFAAASAARPAARWAATASARRPSRSSVPAARPSRRSPSG